MDTQKKVALLLVLLGILCLVGVVLAAPTASALERYVIGSGGGHTDAGIVSIDSTIGQAVTGAGSAGPFDLCSGFWCSPGQQGIPPSHHLYLPLARR